MEHQRPHLLRGGAAVVFGIWLVLASPPMAGAAAARAADASKPNSLTRAEVGDGWLLLFDGESSFGWTPKGDAKWEVRDGALSPVGGTGKGLLCTNTEFADYTLRADYWVDDKANSGVFLRVPAGTGDAAGGYEVNIYDKHAKWPTGSINDVAAVRKAPKTTGKWNTLEMLAEGDHLLVRLNGKTTVDARDAKFRRGWVGLQTNGEGEIRFRNIKLQPHSLKAVFNGKDLSGWKEVPGHKSVFTVTPEGWINVKNGNGDLQSESTWGDFAFQLEVLSNGDHLNSGIFFRAEAGQFWSGYEAQIRNQWQGDDRTKPVDFGTGGIYNLQPTRRVVSSDREWFAMTIIACGRHSAVWVDGIQVSDFQDPRPEKANARQGYRSTAGVVSIQGHDPTTDLSFRKLRIGEYPPIKP